MHAGITVPACSCMVKQLVHDTEKHAALAPALMPCRPLLHAVIEQRVKRTFGVELDAVKCQKAVPFVQHTAALLAADDIQLPESARPNIICLDVGEVRGHDSCSQ